MALCDHCGVFGALRVLPTSCSARTTCWLLGCCFSVRSSRRLRFACVRATPGGVPVLVAAGDLVFFAKVYLLVVIDVVANDTSSAF